MCPSSTDGAPHTAEDVEVVREDRAGRPGRTGEGRGARLGEGAGVVVDLEVEPAAVAVEHEPEPVAVVEEALWARAQAGFVEAREREVLAVVAEPGPAVGVHAAPEVRGAAVLLVADPVVAAEAVFAVAPGEVDALLPVEVVARGMQTLVARASNGMGVRIRSSTPSSVPDVLGSLGGRDVGIADVAHRCDRHVARGEARRDRLDGDDARRRPTPRRRTSSSSGRPRSARRNSYSVSTCTIRGRAPSSPSTRARCMPGGYWMSWPVIGSGSTSATSQDRAPVGDDRHSTRSWNRRRWISPGWIRKPHDVGQHLARPPGCRNAPTPGTRAVARRRGPTAAVCTSENGPNGALGHAVREEADDGRDRRVQRRRHQSPRGRRRGSRRAPAGCRRRRAQLAVGERHGRRVVEQRSRMSSDPASGISRPRPATARRRIGAARASS